MREVSSILTRGDPGSSIEIVWQTDGRPMSGDVGRGMAHAAVSFAKRALHVKETNSLPGYVQLAGPDLFAPQNFSCPATSLAVDDGLCHLHLLLVPISFLFPLSLPRLCLLFPICPEQGGQTTLRPSFYRETASSLSKRVEADSA
jgi:hypothetical protein